MAVAVSAQNSGQWSSLGTASASLTTTTTDTILYLVVSGEPTTQSSTPTVTSVTTSGLTWTRRAAVSNTGGYQRMETWWAYAAAASAYTVAIAWSAEIDDGAWELWSVTGTDTSAPFDSDALLPSTFNASNSSASGPWTAPVSTQGPSPGVVVAAAFPTSVTLSGSSPGMTAVATVSNAGASRWQYLYTEFGAFTYALAQLSLGWTSSSSAAFGTVIADAFSSPAIPGVGSASLVFAGTATGTIAVAPTWTADTAASSATVGSPYTYTYTASGRPAPTFSVASGALPAGLVLGARTGVLSGAPTAAGTSTFTVAASNAAGSVTSGTQTIDTTRAEFSFTGWVGLHFKESIATQVVAPSTSYGVMSGTVPPGVTFNLLSPVDASFETGLGSWLGIANCSLAQSAAEALDGSHSLAMVARTTDGMQAQTPYEANPPLYPMAPGGSYIAIIAFQAALAPRPVQVRIEFATGSETSPSYSAQLGALITDAAGWWTVATVIMTAPPEAIGVDILAQVGDSTSAPTGALPPPSAHAVTPVGTAGSATYSYLVTATNVYGETSPSGNLVPDSDLANAIAASGPTWALTNGTVIGTANGDFTVLNAGASGAEWVYYGTGAAQSFFGPASSAIDVTPGATYTFSAVIDVPASTTNIGDLGILLGPPANPTSFYEYKVASAVGSQVVAIQFVVPSGVTQVSLMCYQNGAVVPAGSTVSWSQIQLTETSTVQPYVAGPAAVNTGNATLSSTNYNTVAWGPVAAPVGSSGNLVYDSDLLYALAAVGPTWRTPGVPIGSAAGDWNIVSPGGQGAQWVYYPGPTQNNYLASALIDVLPNTQYTFSGLLDNPNQTPPLPNNAPAPTVSVGGTAGTTTYSYQIAFTNQNGSTLPSSATTITTGNATLSSANYNNVTWTMPPQNLVTNSSFETGDLTGWVEIGSGGTGVTIEASSAESHGGTYSALIESTGTVVAGLAQQVDMMVGAPGVFSAWVYVTAGSTTGPLSVDLYSGNSNADNRVHPNMSLLNQWQRLSGGWTPNAGNIQVRTFNDGGAASWYIDDVQCETPINLLSPEDASFEGGTAGTCVPGGNCSSVVNSTTVAYDGTHSLEATFTTAGSASWTSMSSTTYRAIADLEYSAQMWVYPSVADNINCSFAYYDGSGNLLGNGNQNAPVVACPATTWTQLTATSIAPPGTVFVTCHPNIPSLAAAGETLNYDSQMIYEGPLWTDSTPPSLYQEIQGRVYKSISGGSFGLIETTWLNNIDDEGAAPGAAPLGVNTTGLTPVLYVYDAATITTIQTLSCGPGFNGVLSTTFTTPSATTSLRMGITQQGAIANAGSAVTWSYLSVVEGPAPANLVFDSNLAAASAPSNATWSGGTAFSILDGRTNEAAVEYFGNGANPPESFFLSKSIAVTPGATYTLSARMNCLAATAGTIEVGLWENDTIGISVQGVALAQNYGADGLVSQTFQMPSGITQVGVACSVGWQVPGPTLSNASVSWSQIQLTETSTVQPYEPGIVPQAGPLWTYNVYRNTSGTYEQIGSTSALSFNDTGQAIGVSAPTTNTTGETHYIDEAGIFPGDTLGYQLEVLSDGPSAYFPLTDSVGATTVANVVGSGNGTVNGGVTFGELGVVASDPSQTAAGFDGTSGYVGTSYQPTFDAITIEVWAKANPADFGTNTRCLAAGGAGAPGFDFYVNNGGYIYIESAGGSYKPGWGSATFNGEWNHYVLTWDGATVASYFDGVQQGTLAAAPGPITCGNPLSIGSYNTGDLFPGSIAQVAIYPTALSASRVSAHYQAAFNTAGSIVQRWTPPGEVVGTPTQPGTYSLELGSSSSDFMQVSMLVNPVRKVLSALDLGQSALVNAVVVPMGSPPLNPELGQIYFDTVQSALGLYNGSTWLYLT